LTCDGGHLFHLQNKRGATPMILAAESGQEAVVELLLHSGAGLHLVDNTDRSALELALENGHLGVLRVLLQQSIVDINGITKRGSSLLHLAAEVGEEDRVTFLLSMQARRDRGALMISASRYTRRRALC
jgi:ankyrin repeat protein